MYDAARMKTVLKGCVGTENPPVATPQDILNRQSAGFTPACNPVVALFAFTTHSTSITKDHFKDCDFMDLFLPGPYPSKARARALLWLLYRYLEDSRGPNPFQDPSSKSNKIAPPVPRMSTEEMELENVDTPEELDYGRKMLQYRIEFLNKTEAEYAQDAAKGKVDPNTNVRGQRAMKKKAAIGRAVQEELAALETQSNLSRDSSLPPSQHPPGLTIGGVDGALHAAVSSGGASVLSPQQVLLVQTERDARHTLAQPPAVSLYNRE
jgi:Ino eighty subunit 1